MYDQMIALGFLPSELNFELSYEAELALEVEYAREDAEIARIETMYALQDFLSGVRPRTT